MTFAKLITHGALLVLLAHASTLQACEAKKPMQQNLKTLEAEAAVLAFQCMALFPVGGKAPCPRTETLKHARTLIVEEIPNTTHSKLRSILMTALASLSRTKL